MHPSGPALVLGSTQAMRSADSAICRERGVAVVRRRSGGAAVLVGPEDVLWVDVVVGSSDPLWCRDVGRAAWWLGEAWAAALSSAGLESPSVWKGPLVRSEWSGAACFGGLGAGEVTLGDGRKVVGISQRRTRAGALFQCACLLRWDPGALVELLDINDESRSRAHAVLLGRAAGIGPAKRLPVLEGLIAALDQAAP